MAKWKKLFTILVVWCVFVTFVFSANTEEILPENSEIVYDIGDSEDGQEQSHEELEFELSDTAVIEGDTEDTFEETSGTNDMVEAICYVKTMNAQVSLYSTDDSEEYCIPVDSGTVLLVIDSIEAGWYRVAFELDGEVVTSRVSANDIARLEPAEIDAFYDSVMAYDVILYNDDINYPLPVVEVIEYSEEAAEEVQEDQDVGLPTMNDNPDPESNVPVLYKSGSSVDSIVITEQPQDVAARDGESVTLHIAATGYNLQYQWYWKNANATSWSKASSAGAKTADWTFDFNSKWDGRQYHCIVTDGNGGSMISDDITLSLITPLLITEQPEDVAAKNGDSITLHIAATGYNLQYQWYWKNANSAIWTRASSAGAKTADWTFAFNSNWDGRQYHCIVTDGTGESVISNDITLSLIHGIVITEQPQDVTARSGESITLHIAATGDNLQYQWYWKNANAAIWAKASSAGAKAADWTFAFNTNWDGRQYHCVVTDGNGESVTSNDITLTAIPGPVITEQPQDVAARNGESITLSIAATGNNLQYQWYWKNASATKWTKASSAAAKAAVWTFDFNGNWDGRQYHCIVTDSSGYSVTSDDITLTLKPGPVITEQPQDIAAKDGDSITLHIAATGNDLQYQWYWKNAGATKWTKASSAGAKTPDWTFAFNSNWDGRQYHCIVTDGSGESATSNDITLSVLPGPVITEQPQDIVAMNGESITLHIAAAGTDLQYQWYWKNANATSWTKASSAGAKSADWTFAFNKSWNGRLYHCVVTDGNGLSVVSDDIVLSFNRRFTIDEVTYYIMDDGVSVLVESYSGISPSLTIPEIIEGYTVIKIGESAFEGNTSLISIDLPDTVQVIGKRAFANCSSLSTMK